MTTKEQVNHPDHYRPGTYEAINVIEAWDLGFHLGNVIKYLARIGRKGDPLEDAKKARWYLDRWIQQQEVQAGRLRFQVNLQVASDPGDNGGDRADFSAGDDLGDDDDAAAGDDCDDDDDGHDQQRTGPPMPTPMVDVDDLLDPDDEPPPTRPPATTASKPKPRPTMPLKPTWEQKGTTTTPPKVTIPPGQRPAKKAPRADKGKKRKIQTDGPPLIDHIAKVLEAEGRLLTVQELVPLVKKSCKNRQVTSGTVSAVLAQERSRKKDRVAMVKPGRYGIPGKDYTGAAAICDTCGLVHVPGPCGGE